MYDYTISEFFAYLVSINEVHLVFGENLAELPLDLGNTHVQQLIVPFKVLL